MRMLVLMMSGLAFTLGLLCGLLLQLPADSHPASVDHTAITDNDNSGFRSRRSLADDGGELVDHAAGQRVAESRSTLVSDFATRDRGSSLPHPHPHPHPHPNPHLASRDKSSFQSPPNPQIASPAFVSGREASDNRPSPALSATPTSNPALHGRGLSRAEQGSQSVKPRAKENNGDEGYENENPPPPPSRPSSSSSSHNIAKKPITSFTLRLTNTGHKFVVDSAVKRRGGEGEEDEEGEEGVTDPARGGPRDPDVQAILHNSNTGGRGAGTLNRTSFKQIGVVTGALWSRKLEDSCPKGFEPQEVSAWRRKAEGMQVVKVEEGCGRMQNRMVTFRDGSRACARYRFNTDQIQGEVYSYYLAQLLNITHLPPALLLPVDSLSPQWRGVHLQMSMAQWADGRLVVLTRWLDELSPSHIPHELREDDRRLHPTADILGGKTTLELCDLLQWSDLIVFDYLTANLDRMVNNMFNRQWNAEMMNNPAHNLERTKGGSLVFLDNESGLFHGYRLLEKYHGYHEALLDSLCVFRASTARAVKVLHGAKSVGEELHKLFTEGELHHRHLPSIPEKNLQVLRERLARVYEQIVKCEAAYA